MLSLDGCWRHCISSPCEPQITPIGGRLSSSASQPSRHLGKGVLLSCQWAGPVSKSQITICAHKTIGFPTETQFGGLSPKFGTMPTSQCRLHRIHPAYRNIHFSCEASCGNLCLDELPPIRCWNNTNNTRCGWKKPTTYRIISGELSDRHLDFEGAKAAVDCGPQTVQGQIEPWIWETNERLGRQMMGDKWRETTAPQTDTP